LTQPFEPTAEQRRLARAMSGLGLPQEQIAFLLEIDPKTLRKHFRDDLDRGMSDWALAVMAFPREHSIPDPSLYVGGWPSEIQSF